MTHYVCGFAFTQHGNRVLLIRKNRPAWQAGMLNGIGGHVEAGESSITAQVREFREETGVDTKPEQWVEFGVLKGSDFVVTLFALFDSKVVNDAATTGGTTDEKVFQVDTATIGRESTIRNLAWIVPAAALIRVDEQFTYITALYK